MDKISDDLLSRAAVLLAVSIANWPAVYKIIKESKDGSPEQQNRLDGLSLEARSEALLLLSLQRALEQSGLQQAEDIMPAWRSLAASYAIVALAVDREEIIDDALIHPQEIPQLLGKEGQAVLKQYGQTEALRRLEEG